VVVAVSDTEPVHRCGRALSRPAKRLAIAGGLVLASWALGAVLSTTTASAHELTTPDTATVTETSTTNSSADAEKSTSTKKTPKPVERKKEQSSSGAGLLGGLLSSVVNTLGSTVNAVTGTVTGLVSAVNETVLAPITGGGSTGDGTPPPKLPVIGDLLPTPGWSGGGQWQSGGTVTITVPAKQPAVAVPAAPQPEAPQPPAPVVDTPAVVSHPVQSTHVSAHVLKRRTAVDEPARSDKHFSAPSGGGSGGGRGDLPAAPSTPAAPTTTAPPALASRTPSSPRAPTRLSFG
jgi:hypothetical protein